MKKTKRAKGSLTKADELLSTALSRFGLKESLDKYKFIQHWEEIVGSDVAKISKPEFLSKTEIVIKVTSSVWASELSFQKDFIIFKLNKFLPEKFKVSELRFVVDPSIKKS